MSRNQIIIVSLSALGLALVVLLALTFKGKKPQDLPPPAENSGGGGNIATNTPAPIQTNTPAVPPTGVPTNSVVALQQEENLKAALESLSVDHGFDAEGNLLWLGLGGLPVTDAALAKLAGETKLHALYLYDTKITDEGLKQLAGLTGLRLLLLTATSVTDAGVSELEAALPECAVVR